MLTTESVTPALKSAVSAYLMAEAYAQTLREAVDEIETAVLKECPLRVDPKWNEGRRSLDFEYITEPKHVYLTDLDSQEYKEHRNEVRIREQEAGLRKDCPTDDHCPALMAEEATRQCKHLVVSCGVEMMQETAPELTEESLWRSMKQRERFIDLCCKLVVNLPDFRNPLTGKGAA